MTRALALLSLLLAIASTGAIGLPSHGPELGELGAVSVGCSPRVRERLPSGAARGGCILLRALTDDGSVHEVCEDVEDLVDQLGPILVPLVEELISKHRDARVERGAQIAFALPVATLKKPRAPPKRRCAQWIDLTDAGATPVDAGGD